MARAGRREWCAPSEAGVSTPPSNSSAPTSTRPRLDKWIWHLHLSNRGRVLVGADELDGGVETPASLGAHHSRLPARAIFFQHPEQSHSLAVGMAAGEPDPNRSCGGHL